MKWYDKHLKALEEIEEEKKKVAKAYNKRMKARSFQEDTWRNTSRVFGIVSRRYLKKYFPSVWQDAQEVL